MGEILTVVSSEDTENGGGSSIGRERTYDIVMRPTLHGAPIDEVKVIKVLQISSRLSVYCWYLGRFVYIYCWPHAYSSDARFLVLNPPTTRLRIISLKGKSPSFVGEYIACGSWQKPRRYRIASQICAESRRRDGMWGGKYA